MFDNPVLDIAIGLTFIYVLYSLLATTIKEFVATIFAYRGKMLERGIEQMLDGTNVKYFWWDRIANFFLWQVQKGKVKRQLTGGYKLALGAAKKAKKDAEKEADDKLKAFRKNRFYAKAVVNELTVIPSNSASLTASIAAPAIYLKRRKLNKKAELFAAKITDHPLYKRSSDNSWFSNGPAYLKSDVFSDILLDLLKPEGKAPLLLSDIAKAITDKANDPAHPLNEELKKILNIYIEQANGDLQRFKLLLENWYDQTMDRVTGWYKKQATKILIIIGLVLAMAFKVSTIDIIKRLSEDKPTRDALVKNAQEYVSKNIQHFGKAKVAADTAKRIADSIRISDSITRLIPTQPADHLLPGTPNAGVNLTNERKDSIAKATVTILAKQQQPDTSTDAITDAKLRLKRIDTLYQQIAPNNDLLGLGWGDFGAAEDSIECLKHPEDSAYFKYQRALLQYNTEKSKDKNYAGKEPEKPWMPGFGGKLWFVIIQTITTPRFLLGFLITAFAISLGAPFWFDLLNKFINLRVSGTKPEETSKASKTADLNKKPDPTAKG